RQELEQRAALHGPEALHAELSVLDPAAAAAIDARNVRRLVRALEVVKTTGQPWSGRSDLWSPAYYHPTLIVGLVLEREVLYRRIDERAERIVRGGAIEEVRQFRVATGIRPGAPGIASAIGYREICAYLDGQQDLSATIAQLAAATRRYARRQLTWLRKLKDAVIIEDRGRSPAELAQEVLALAETARRT
ncbi:MAG: tRNA (adenosine(37)-N6)-dimethylallyltransferase MiaA, partial [Thermoleophilia bacterium]|nr:tRNA (adenosine(37)-N6)-dimethylallyltransferase MiaA [Thermoleophilia bacterium]